MMFTNKRDNEEVSQNRWERKRPDGRREEAHGGGGGVKERELSLVRK
jgi:hypothetical protein